MNGLNLTFDGVHADPSIHAKLDRLESAMSQVLGLLGATCQFTGSPAIPSSDYLSAQPWDTAFCERDDGSFVAEAQLETVVSELNPQAAPLVPALPPDAPASVPAASFHLLASLIKR